MIRTTPFLVLLILSMTALVSFQIPVPSGSAAPLRGRDGAIGTDDDPDARAGWELMRRRNPATGRIPDGIAARERSFAAKLPDVGDRRGPLSSVEWRSIGPDNVGGRTRALAVDLDNERIILAGGVSGGMWRSLDGGASWTRTTPPDQLQAVSCVAQDRRPGKRNVWYYTAGGELDGATPQGGGGAYYHGDGIFKSTDGGASWNALASTLTRTPQQWDGPFDYVWNIATDPSPATESRLYAASVGGIYRSSDGGDSWNPVLGVLWDNARYTDVAVAADGTVYATLSSDGKTKGIWRSRDGLAWTEITPAGWPASWQRIVIGIAPADPATVYFLGVTPGDGGRGYSLWSYHDAPGNGSSGTWENRSANLPTDASTGVSNGTFFAQGSYDLTIAVHPANPALVFIGGTNLFRSNNGFASAAGQSLIGGYTPANWQIDGHHCDQHAIAFSPSDPNRIFSANDGGVSVAENCTAPVVSWRSLNNGYATAQFYTIAVSRRPGGPATIIGGAQDVGTWITSDTARRWRSSFGDYGSYAGDGGYCAIADDSTAYYSFQGGRIYRLNPAGHGQYGTLVTPRDAVGFGFITPFILDPNDPRIMYLAAGNRLWRNSDLTAIPASNNAATAINWQRFGVPEPAGSVTALGMAGVPDGPLYLGTSAGELFRVDHAAKADPAAALPRTLASDLFPKNAYISSIAVNPENADDILLVFSNYEVRSLFHSSDGGVSWRDVSGNLEEKPDGTGAGPSCRWGRIVPTATGRVFLVGTSTGLYATSNIDAAGVTWEREGASTIGGAVVDMIDARTSDGLVVIGTHGSGAFAAHIGGAPAVGAPAEFDRLFSLDAVSPNPARGVAMISYHLSERRHVRITLLDPAGRIVSTLADTEGAEGLNTCRLDAARLAAGIYFYRLEAGENVATGKLVVEH
ncbi:MAG: hypothetical protein JWQ98_2448 [Chlorobi bacterium]|nr:hypothetical protein [Chlorobiota bacterium]